MKTIDELLRLNYRTTVYLDDEGDFIVEVPDLPGLAADGKTPDEAFAELEHAKRAWMESRRSAKLPIPEPQPIPEYSGRLVVRMPRSLHARLANQAGLEGVSLNQYIVSLLADGSTSRAVSSQCWADSAYMESTFRRNESVRVGRPAPTPFLLDRSNSQPFEREANGNR
ncbi:MAG: toxin-antitoxin system HicB family antitoxin [Terriglobales bacterium]